MIENRVLRNEERDKRQDHRSARNTFTNLIADGTNCSRFEAVEIARNLTHSLKAVERYITTFSGRFILSHR